MNRVFAAAILAATVALGPTPASAAPEAVSGRIVKQSLDAQRIGYTVLSVWGSHYQMGFAQGSLLAEDVLFAVNEAKDVFAKVIDRGRERVAKMIFAPDGIEDELRGVVEGVKSVLPDADITVTDLKVINTIADWLYPPGCNSHSSWGSRVKAPIRTLSSRRLDTPLLYKSRAIKHHVLIAREATKGENVRWVNVAWPGYVLSLTGVNEYGVLASLHDDAHDMHSSPKDGHLPRMVANRLLLTAVHGVPLAKQLDFVYALLREYTVATGGFINWYAPDGAGGVISCLAGQVCWKKRVPQVEFHGGEVLITTNFETDGKTAPMWGEYLDDFYKEGGAHTMSQHFDVLTKGKAFSPPTHALSVAYRGRGDMTLRFIGATDNDGAMTKEIDFEFAELFGKRSADSTGAGGSGTADQADGGGCAMLHAPSGAILPLLVVLFVWVRRRGRRARARQS